MKIGQSAFDLIIAEEVSSQAFYERHYTRPEWPGGQSGVTVAIGYDLGYATPDKITADWLHRVSYNMISVMRHCSGVRGAEAKKMLKLVRNDIEIPWQAAIEVFGMRDIPHWTSAVLAACPGAEKLAPNCLGALVSLAYNRGCSFDEPGNRYIEMREIKAAIGDGHFTAIPQMITSMKRLWPNVRGLCDRRDREAALFIRGLNPVLVDTKPAPVSKAPPVPDQHVLTAGPARSKPPGVRLSAGGIVVAGSAVAARAAGAEPWMVGAIVLSAALFSGLLLYLWHRNLNP